MRRSNQQYYNQEEFNAEELFNMFFGGGFPQSKFFFITRSITTSIF